MISIGLTHEQKPCVKFDLPRRVNCQACKLRVWFNTYSAGEATLLQLLNQAGSIVCLLAEHFLDLMHLSCIKKGLKVSILILFWVAIGLPLLVCSKHESGLWSFNMNFASHSGPPCFFVLSLQEKMVGVFFFFHVNCQEEPIFKHTSSQHACDSSA